MGKVVTFGEIMLRLEPEGYLRFVQASSFGAIYGGGEANVAIALANFGVDAAFVTKLPKHEIGQAAVNTLRQFGVDTSKITRGGDRVGIYFLEKGASQRASKVIYDRAGSSIAKASAADFDWNAIFEGASWFHFTGITPALGDNVAELCAELCGRFGYERGAGYFAGLGHDMAREMPVAGLAAEAEKAHLALSDYEKTHPVLLHGPVAAFFLRKMFGVLDEEILEAVRCHSLGAPDMGLLSKILFVADYCEPGRAFIDAAFREACFSLPLDAMLVYIVDNEKRRGHTSAPETEAMYEGLKKKMRGETL
jgi:predicted HD superfamily hydrolase involved in NAD metabolism